MLNGISLRLTVILVAIVFVAVLVAGCTLNIPSSSGTVTKAPVTTARTAVSYKVPNVPVGDPNVSAAVRGNETAAPVANASAGATTAEIGQPTEPITTSTEAGTPATAIVGAPAEATTVPTPIGGGTVGVTTPTTYPTPIGGGTHEITITTTATTIAVSTTPTQDCKGDFVGSPRSGTAPLTVTFTSLTPCDADTRTWKFGDGTVIEKTGQKTETHTYTQPGSYRVELLEVKPPSVYGADRTDYITVTAASPAGSTPTAGIAVKPPTDLKVNPSLFITETPTARASLALKQPTNLQVNPDLIVTPKISLVANVPNRPGNPQI